MINESELIAQLKDKRTREKAFTRMVREYQEPLYWQIRLMVHSHEDADDLLQNCFLKAWTSIDDFRGEAKLSTWLFRIATNMAINHVQREKSTLSIEDTPSVQTQSEKDINWNDTYKQFLEAIDSLPPKQRAVFILKYYQEMTYEEMSLILNTSIGALKASYHHAVKRISDFFDPID